MAFSAGWQRLLALQGAPVLTRQVLLLGVLVANLLSGTLMLVSIGDMMGQPPLSLDHATVEALVKSTPQGRSFLARQILLIAAAGLLLVDGKGWLLTSLLGAAVVTLAWNGHAAAGEGAEGAFHLANNIVHLLAVGLWMGAVAGFLGQAWRHSRTEASSARHLLQAMQRFAPWGISLVVLVTITGVVNIGLIIGWEDLGSAVRTPYGQLMLAKLAVVGLILLCAAANAVLSRRCFQRAEPIDPETTVRAPLTSLWAEMLLMAAALALVAVLGMTSPNA
jgi:putative copper resistance protein D